MDQTRSGRTGTLPVGALASVDARDEAGDVSRRGFLTAAGMSFIAATLAACGGAGDTIGPVNMTPGGNSPGGSGSPPGSTLPPGVTIAGSSVVINVLTQTGLASAGGFLVVNSGLVHAMVINTGANTFSAFTSVCTHDGCNNSWSFTGVRFRCNCHGSEFNTTGAAVVGPATAPLASYPATFDMGTSTVTVMTSG